jgi:hypothetical protein
MKATITLIFFLFSLPTIAIEPCGKKSSELKYPQLNWQKALTVKVNNSFQDSEGIICAGLTKNQPAALSRIIYRDIDGRVIDADINQLKNGVAIVSDRDLPSEAAPVLRPGQYVVLKTGNMIQTASQLTYPISLKFLRNLSRGFSAKDFRELNLSGSVSGSQISMLSSNTKFDEIEMNLSTLPVAFENIYFYSERVMVKKTNSNSLKQIPSLF